MANPERLPLPKNKQDKQRLLRRLFESTRAETDKQAYQEIIDQYQVSLRSLKTYKKTGGWERGGVATDQTPTDGPTIVSAPPRAEPSDDKRTRERKKKARHRAKKKTESEQAPERVISERVNKEHFPDGGSPNGSSPNGSSPTKTKASKKLPTGWRVAQGGEEAETEGDTTSTREDYLESIQAAALEMIIQGVTETTIYQFHVQKKGLTPEEAMVVIDRAKQSIRDLGFVDLPYESNKIRLRLEMLFKRAVATKQDYRAYLITKEQIELYGIREQTRQQADALEQLIGRLTDEQLLKLDAGDYSVLEDSNQAAG